MTELNEAPLASSYLEQAVTELNKNDGKGIVAQIKMHIKLVTANNKKIKTLQDSNAKLLKEINKLASEEGIKVDDFVIEQ